MEEVLGRSQRILTRKKRERVRRTSTKAAGQTRSTKNSWKL